MLVNKLKEERKLFNKMFALGASFVEKREVLKCVVPFKVTKQIKQSVLDESLRCDVVYKDGIPTADINGDKFLVLNVYRNRTADILIENNRPMILVDAKDYQEYKLAYEKMCKASIYTVDFNVEVSHINKKLDALMGKRKVSL